MLEKTLTDIYADREHIDAKFKSHFLFAFRIHFFIYIKDGTATSHSSERLFQTLP